MGLCHWLTSCKPSEERGWGWGAGRLGGGGGQLGERMSQSSIEAPPCVSQLRAKALMNQPSLSVFFFFSSLSHCLPTSRRSTLAQTFELQHAFEWKKDMGWIFRWMRNRAVSAVLEAAPSCSADRPADLARSIPSQGLIGQVGRPDVTPNPPHPPPAPSLWLPVRSPPERPESSPGFPGHKPSFVCPQQHRVQP